MTMKIKKENGGRLVWEKSDKSLIINIKDNKVISINDVCISFYSLNKNDVIGKSIENVFSNWQDIWGLWECNNEVFQKHPEIFKEYSKSEKEEHVFLHILEHGNKKNLGLVSLKSRKDNIQFGINFPFIFDYRDIQEKIEAYENLHEVIGASHGIYMPAIIINHLCTQDCEQIIKLNSEKIKNMRKQSGNIMFESNKIIAASHDLMRSNDRYLIS